MALPQYLLNRTFPRINLSKINIEGQEKNISIGLEIELIRPFKASEAIQVFSGVDIYATDEDISSIGSLQSFFENRVITNYIQDLSFSPNKEKIITENNKKYVSRTHFFNVSNLFLDKKNIIIFYGSWVANQTTGEVSFSKVEAEIIFEDNKIKSESYLYLIKDTGDVWQGSVKRSDDKLTFVTDESTPKQLERYTTKNYKIQDFRTHKKIQKSISDYNDLNNKVLNLKSRQLLKQENQKKKYFTDLYISQKNNIAASFGIDFANIVFDNSLFAKDPATPNDVRNEIFINSKIVELKIVKRKVKPTGKNTNRITDTRDSVEIFPGSKEETIASGKDEEQQFVSLDLLKENKTIFQSMKNNMRFFTCIDNNIDTKNNSIYQYGVKIEIMDGSKKMTIKDISELQTTVSELQQYYNTLLVNISSENADSVYTEDEISRHVTIYVSKLVKYYMTQEYQEIFDSVLASVSPVNLLPETLQNFINLCKILISNLQKMIGENLNSFDDPHTEEENNVTKNTKNTFTVEYYFVNNIYDTSLSSVKKVEYLPISQNDFFNEFEFSNNPFGDRLQISKTDLSTPISTEVAPFSFSYKTAIKQHNGKYEREFSRTEEQQEIFGKIIRENLLKHVNIDITKKYSKEVDIKQANREEREDDSYNQDIAEMYRYFSSTNVRDKQIDEVFDLYEQYKQDFLTKIEFLKKYNSVTGKEEWANLHTLLSERLEIADGQILCRLKPQTEDYRSTSWMLSENIRMIDIFFFLNVSDFNDLASSYSSFFGTDTSPSVNVQAPIQVNAIQKVKQRNLLNNKIENAIRKEQPLKEKIKISTRNLVLNGK